MLRLEKPEVKDYWYEQKIQSDPKTMSYNKGYEVTYKGYHYDTGCIDFEEKDLAKTYAKRHQKNIFLFYLKNTTTNEYVGYTNYYYNEEEKRYECGILIEASKRGKGYAKEGLQLLCNEDKRNGIKALYDSFEKDRPGIHIFKELGFQIIEEKTWLKDGQEVTGIIVCKEL